jgi:hypothetical protein
MAVVSPKYKYLFIMSPRTGSTALGRDVLIPHLDGDPLTPRVARPDGTVLLRTQHASLDDLMQYHLLTAERARQLLKFTTVRNPFDSLVSEYVRQRRRHIETHDVDAGYGTPRAVKQMRNAATRSFPEWIEMRYTRRGARTIGCRAPLRRQHLHGRYMKGMDVLMRYERLQADFDGVLDRLGIAERYQISAFNGADEPERRDYRPFYDTPSRELVARVFEPDLERFGYQF